MIPKRVDDITEDDLLALITNGVGEGRTIDYKRELPGNGDADKKEFLADVSSFANTSGGDLVFGIDEDQGLPTQITGFQSIDTDLEVRRLESILTSGLDPRLRYAARVVTCGGGKKTLIIRVDRSWSGPHRVVFKGHDRFYGRNSAGKYPLDVNELRAAFTLSGSLTERIRAFRTDRIIELSINRTPVPFVPNPKIVLHCIPVEAFAGQPQCDILPFYQNPVRLRPMGNSGWDRRLNLEGLIAFSAGQPSFSYIQLYRNGVIEVVNGLLLAQEYKGTLIIPSISYEQHIFEYLPYCFQVMKEMGSNVPVVVALTLTNTRGLRMGVDSYGLDVGHSIDKDILILPETVIEDFSIPAGKILKPIFDLIWNASGYPSSKNFDSEGNWVKRRG
jgi:hypothetical protein